MSKHPQGFQSLTYLSPYFLFSLTTLRSSCCYGNCVFGENLHFSVLIVYCLTASLSSARYNEPLTPSSRMQAAGCQVKVLLSDFVYHSPPLAGED